MQRRQLGPARFDWSEQLIAFELLDAILRGSELY